MSQQPASPKSPIKKPATTSSAKGAFLYKTDRERLDAVVEEGRRRSLSPKQMLDRIIDDWFDGVYPAPHTPENKKPWYME